MSKAVWLDESKNIYRCSNCRCLYYYEVERCPFCKSEMSKIATSGMTDSQAAVLLKSIIKGSHRNDVNTIRYGNQVIDALEVAVRALNERTGEVSNDD